MQLTTKSQILMKFLCYRESRSEQIDTSFSKIGGVGP